MVETKTAIYSNIKEAQEAALELGPDLHLISTVANGFVVLTTLYDTDCPYSVSCYSEEQKADLIMTIHKARVKNLIESVMLGA